MKRKDRRKMWESVISSRHGVQVLSRTKSKTSLIYTQQARTGGKEERCCNTNKTVLIRSKIILFQPGITVS